MQWPSDILSKPPQLLLLDLIYISTGIRIELRDVEAVGIPQVVDQRLDLDDDPDTFITVDIKTDSDTRFDRVEGYMYRRIKFHEVGLLRIGSEFVFPLTLHGILTQLNAKYKINLTPADVIDRSYTERPAYIDFVANPNSLNWEGDIQLPTGDVLFAITDLDGFKEVVLAA